MGLQCSFTSGQRAPELPSPDQSWLLRSYPNLATIEWRTDHLRKYFCNIRDNVNDCRGWSGSGNQNHHQSQELHRPTITVQLPYKYNLSHHELQRGRRPNGELVALATSDRIAMFLAAVHKSVPGTTRTAGHVRLRAAVRGIADSNAPDLSCPIYEYTA